MSGILFIDTETTAMANFKLPASDPSQPRVIQVAAILTDVGGNIVSQFSTLVSPDGWTISPEAQRVHGITMEQCQAFGMESGGAIVTVDQMAQRCDTIVAHNIEFDWLLMQVEFHRSGWPHWRMPNVPVRDCTMKLATPVLKIPGKYQDYKWPSLAETYRYLFERELDGAHDAMADVLACKQCYFELVKLVRRAAS